MGTGRYDNMFVRVKIVIAISDDKSAPSFGRGAAMLLHGVDETGSLNQAAKRLHMAYSKAWKMIHRLEVALGFELMERHGSSGSIVTDRAHDLMDRYERLEQSISEFAVQEFAENVKGAVE